MVGASHVVWTTPHPMEHSVYVVPTDASAAIKSWAGILSDAGFPVFICDGASDEVEIEAAFALGNANKSMRLLPGNFTCGSVLQIPVVQNYFFDARGATILGGIHMDSAMDSTFLFDVISSSTTALEIEPSADSEILGADEVFYLINVNIEANALSISGTPPTVGSYGLKVTLANGKRCAGNRININLIERAETAIYVNNPSGASDRHFHKNSINVKAITQCDHGVVDGQLGNVTTKYNQWNIGFVESRTGGSGNAVAIYGQDQYFHVDGVEGDFLYSFVLGSSSTNNTIYASSAGYAKSISDSSTGTNKFIGAAVSRCGVATNVALDGSGVGAIAHGALITPTVAFVQPQSENLSVRVTSIDSTSINILVQDLAGTVVTADTHDFYWKAEK